MVVGDVGRFKVTQPLFLLSLPPSKHFVIFKTSSTFSPVSYPASCFVFPLSLAKGLAPFTKTMTELSAMAIQAIRERPNLEHNFVTHKY